jgi:hypothetical protein
MPRPFRGRRGVFLGYGDDGSAVSLAVRGRNLLVTGEPNAGKSWAAGLLAEQLILHRYAVCVIDPEGDYGSLESLPDVTLFGGDEPPPRPRQILRAFRHPDQSGVIDLSQMAHVEEIDYVRALLSTLSRLRRVTGLPHRIVLDEAHYFLQDPDLIRMLDLGAGSYTFVTYRVSGLHPEVLSAMEGTIVTRQSDPREIEWLRAAFGGPDLDLDLGRLALGRAVLLPGLEEGAGIVRPFRLASRLTSHVRHRSKYIDVPVPSSRAFVFTDKGTPVGSARTMNELIAAIGAIRRAVFDDHLRRHDLSRWLADVFGDHLLAAEVRGLEDRHRLASIVDIRGSIITAIGARYEIDDPSGLDAHAPSPM